MAEERNLASEWESEDHDEAPHYHAPYTLACFHESDEFVRGIMGPIGSGKSTGCAWELMMRANKQRRSGREGKRFTRWAVIRNTYRELEDTTVKTWFDWFPPGMGTWHQAKMTHTILVGDLHCEVLFRALDRPDDVKKLLSLELTGAWVNEAREVPKTILDMLTGRVGRYPSKRRHGPTWHGIFMDTNPPDQESWWYRTFEEQRPRGWALFRQPSARSKAAENRENLPRFYYERLMSGKTDEWIAVYVDGEYGFTSDGKPVHPGFNRRIHVLKHPPRVNQRLPVGLGADFGLTPAGIVGQKHPMGRWVIHAELTTEDTGASTFGTEFRSMLNRQFPGVAYEGWGDPAGDTRSDLREWETVFTVLSEQGIDLLPAPTNDPVTRIEAVNSHLRRMSMDGEPSLLISPKCLRLIKGLSGGYQYKRVGVAGEERFHEKPFKNIYSHVVEALQYLLVGAGDADRLLLPEHHGIRDKPVVRRSITGGSIRAHDYNTRKVNL